MEQSNTSPIVLLNGITCKFGDLVANDNVKFDLIKGEIHALLGENGAGKSTLMSVLYGLYKPVAGEILCQGKPRQSQISIGCHRIGDSNGPSAFPIDALPYSCGEHNCWAKTQKGSFSRY